MYSFSTLVVNVFRRHVSEKPQMTCPDATRTTCLSCRDDMSATFDMSWLKKGCRMSCLFDLRDIGILYYQYSPVQPSLDRVSIALQPFFQRSTIKSCHKPFATQVGMISIISREHKMLCSTILLFDYCTKGDTMILLIRSIKYYILY